MEADDPDFEQVLHEIHLSSLKGRSGEISPGVVDLVQQTRDRAFGTGGKMLLGLHICFIAIAELVLQMVGQESVDDPFQKFETTASRAMPGTSVETLTFFVNTQVGEERVPLRPLYNDFSNLVRGSHIRRPSYPSSPGYATGKWQNHRSNLELIFSMSPGERRAVAELLWQAVMELPRAQRRLPPRTVREPFVQALEEFDRRAMQDETSGASFQGLLYGFVVADAPGLQFRTASARTGGKRQGLVGDIDGYDGPDLQITTEVKDRDLSDVNDITDFYSNLELWPDAVAFVACRSGTDQFVTDAMSLNITVRTQEQLVSQVRLWTVSKQLHAIRNTMGYFDTYEKKPALADRFQRFLAERDIDLRG
jgi:hypothetical protein